MEKRESFGNVRYIPEMEDVLGATDLGHEHVVDDWPWGRKQRCSMHFFVESHPKRGERFVKQSTMKGRTYKPKTSTYCGQVKIIELDGTIGHVEWSKSYFMFSVYMEAQKYCIANFHDEEATELAKHFFKE